LADSLGELAAPGLSGMLPWDADGHWQVLGLAADPGVLEINLPVCHSWAEYDGWLRDFERAVEMDGDMRSATVHVSVMGDETKQRLALKGLARSAGFLQSRIADRIETRYTPKLRFELDGGIKKSIEIARMLHEVLPPTPTDGDTEPSSPSVASQDDA
jgi:hypothetical protein